MDDGVRTTQEQLSTNPVDEALNAPNLFKKRSNGLKSAVAVLLIFVGRITIFCKLALTTVLFSCF